MEIAGRILLAAVLLACVGLTIDSCSAQSTPPVATPTPDPAAADEVLTAVTVGPGIYRFIDKEAQVVCWKSYQGGLACLPLNETALRGGK